MTTRSEETSPEEIQPEGGDPGQDGPEESLQVRLYVAPNSRSSTLAKRNLQVAIDVLQPDDLELEIIDVTEQPGRAAQDRALVTPLLVRVQPGPIRKVGGTLDDQASLLAVLSGIS